MTSTMKIWTYDDGGREAAGHKGAAEDCVTRAIAIACGLGYAEVYDALREAMLREKTRRLRLGRGEKMRSTSPADRVPMNLTRAYLDALGWTWTPTMQVGSGCRVHLRADELPAGRLIARCSGHLVAVVDGVIRDTYDPTRGGTRCVYGYWSEGAATGRSS